MLLFIPILRFSNYKKNPDMIGLKYFFTQSLASIILFVSVLIIIILSDTLFKFSIILRIRLAWKLGIPPFHIWLFNLIIELDWALFFIISSWQKILPYYLIRQIILEWQDFLILTSLITSIIMALNQRSVKKLLIISSIFTSGWVLRSMAFIKIWWLLFFSFYCVILFFCSLIFFVNKIRVSERMALSEIRVIEKVRTFFLLMSIGGLPPFLGFYIKLFILLILLQNIKVFILLCLVIASVVILYLYLRLILRSLITQILTFKRVLPYKVSNYPSYLSCIYVFSPLIIILF